tara:strand:+ start:401 stop:973 length:573 start_codon:yes stop_codon:yes gene_type:complete
LAAAVSMAACGGPRAFTRGSYEDPNEIVLLDDKWTPSDMQLVAKKMIDSMEAWYDANTMTDKPEVILEMPRNRTAEHIDMKALYEHIRTALINSGKFGFLDKDARQEIADEMQYQRSGYVDPSEAIAPGKQKAAEYLMGGSITSTVQEVGNNKVVYYKATFKLTNIETTEILWTDHKEIRKDFKKKSIGF